MKSLSAVLALSLATFVTPAAGQTRHVAADADFMRNMILHHEQALQMAALVKARSSNDRIISLARRIAVSQESEIALMQGWLSEQQEPLADSMHHHHGMPGMLSAAEMQELRQSSGRAFDSRFLELMIRHHEGALAMVEQLVADRRAGQEPMVFQLASGIDADQRAEIRRMKRLLREISLKGSK